MRYRLLAATAALAGLIATPAAAQFGVYVGPSYDGPYYSGPYHSGVYAAAPYAHGPAYGYAPGYAAPGYSHDSNGVLYQRRGAVYGYAPYPAPTMIYRGGPRTTYW